MKSKTTLKKKIDNNTSIESNSHFPSIVSYLQKQSIIDNVVKHFDFGLNRRQNLYNSIQINHNNQHLQRLSVLQSSKKRAKSRMHTLSAKSKINFISNRTPNAKAQKIKSKINEEIGKHIKSPKNQQKYTLINPEEILRCIELDAEKIRLRKIQYLLYKDYHQQKQSQSSKPKPQHINKLYQLSSSKINKSKLLPIVKNKGYPYNNQNSNSNIEQFSKRIEQVVQQCLSPWKFQQQNQIGQHKQEKYQQI